MAVPPEDQVQFLLRIQRLLREGQFTATYKYALLMALADLSVECGDDSGAALDIDTTALAAKFIGYYWRQTVPFQGKGTLRQNKGASPVIINELVRLRGQYGDHLTAAQREPETWRRLIGTVSRTVRQMPLAYLQNVGKATNIPFLYDQPASMAPAVIRLYPGVAYCFRRFHGLILELVQSAWVRWVHEQNPAAIGEQADLHTFLFGSSRASLAAVREPLRNLQKNRCFYCANEMRTEPDVDHFVPWYTYQLDLGHNFVLVHPDCNNAKRDRLAAEKHLSAWVQRNEDFGVPLSHEFDRLAFPHNLSTTRQIARWAYESTANANGLAWVSKQELVPLSGEWRQLLG